MTTTRYSHQTDAEFLRTLAQETDRRNMNFELQQESVARLENIVAHRALGEKYNYLFMTDWKVNDMQRAIEALEGPGSELKPTACNSIYRTEDGQLYVIYDEAQLVHDIAKTMDDALEIHYAHGRALGGGIAPAEHAQGDAHSLFRGLLAYTGDNPDRPGLAETPARVMKAFDHWFGGYSIDVPALLKVFEDGAEGADQMVVVKGIPVYSKCEHHMADIFGTATVAYIPNGKIVGLSKLSRVVDAYARRLQVQERLTNNIADAIYDNLQPLGVGVVIQARHMCMESRGICQQGHYTITSALRGVVLTERDARQEFFSFVDSK